MTKAGKKITKGQRGASQGRLIGVAELAALRAAQRASWARSLAPCEHGRVDIEQCFHCREAARAKASSE